jgi:hypothetical protein
VQRADAEKYNVVTMTTVVVPAGIKLILKSQIMSKGARISSVRHSESITTKKISGEIMWRQVSFEVFDPCWEIGRYTDIHIISLAVI